MMLFSKLLSGLFVMLFAVLAVFAASTHAATITVVDDVIELRGEIDTSDGERFVARMTPAIRSLRIRSGGGDMNNALTIAKAVRDGGLSVDIDGLCGSACAQLILPAATHVHARDGTLVAMHAVADGALRAARREGRLAEEDDPAVAQAFAAVIAFQDEMDAFLASVGMRPDAFDFVYALTSVSDVTVSVAGREFGRVYLAVNGRQAPICRGWLLGPADLRDIGIHADDWSPGGYRRAAVNLVEKPSELYDGPRVEILPEDHRHDCGSFSRRVKR
jgi:hypothetical protein